MGDENQVNSSVTEEMGDEDEVKSAITEENAGETEPEANEVAENGATEQEAEKDQESAFTKTENPIPEPNKNIKTVANILHKVKEDTEMSSEQKIDTLSMLLTKFVEENGV